MPAVEDHSLGQPLDGWNGICNVDGDPAAGHGRVGDVQVAVGPGSTGSIQRPPRETWVSYRIRLVTSWIGVVAAQAWGEQAVG